MRPQGRSGRLDESVRLFLLQAYLTEELRRGAVPLATWGDGVATEIRRLQDVLDSMFVADGVIRIPAGSL